MGKSEVNPYATYTESSSDSETDYATEVQPPACDGKASTSGEDEPKSTAAEARKFRRGGPWAGRGGINPMMFMMMMGGPPGGRHGYGYPGYAAPPPFMMRRRANTPEGKKTVDKPSRCPGAVGGPAGPCGPAEGVFGPQMGPRRHGGPCMRRRFMRHMLSNPEFWRRMERKLAEEEEEGPKHEESSKMDKKEKEAAKEKKNDRKCNGERREKWHRFMKHMLEEMNNFQASTESEGDEGNSSDKCTEETAQKEAAKEKKQVHFGDNEYYDANEMMSQGYPWMFRGNPWGRPGACRGGRGLRHNGPWMRPGHFREASMHGDPRMGRDPRMMFGGPRMWMFRQMMNSASSDEDRSGSEAEDQIKKQRSEMREKRQKFRKVVQDLGVRPWMFRILAHQIYGKKTDSDEDVAPKEVKNEKMEKYLQTLEELGAYPWMFRVLANQRARAAATASDSEGDAAPEGVNAPTDGAKAAVSPARERMMQRRRMFRQWAKQMGWTPATSDSEQTDDETDAKKKVDKKEKRKEEREKMREVMRQMGWMPWMMWGRRAHHHHRHASPAAVHGHQAECQSDTEKSGDEEQITKRDEKRGKMQKEMRDKRQKFRETVQEMGVRPWMFKLLAEEIYGKKQQEAAATSEAEATDDDKKQNKKGERKEKYQEALRQIGAYPWMFRVLANQKARADGNKSDLEAQTPADGAAAEKSPDRATMRQRRKMFCQRAKQMGWTSDSEATASDGEALTDGEKEAKKEVDEQKEKRRAERQKMRRMMREMGWMPWMMMFPAARMGGRLPHQPQPGHVAGHAHRHMNEM